MNLNRTDSWSRHAYPVQRSSTDPLPTPPLDDELPQTTQLPRNIRATKNADKYRVKGKTIVLCLDGTGDKFDNDNSNIVNFVSCLKKDDKTQATYYQAGIGTYSSGGLSSGLSAALDMAVGSGLGLHVRDAYHFLMHTYKEGDKICILGFSRGAYTARCLAGMVHKVGLLPPRNIAQIPFAYEFYKDDTAEGWKQSADFKKTFCIDANVYFVGVFDSVASVGFIPRQLPLSSTPTSKTRHFRHAMALDEHRSKFAICRYQQKDFKAILKSDPNISATTIEALKESYVNGATEEIKTIKSDTKQSKKAKKKSRGRLQEDSESSDSEYERRTGHSKPFDTDVLEVWFLGCHADVGGGAVANIERHKLSQIPLRWMIRQCFECNTGILFNTKALAEVGLDLHTLWPKYNQLPVPVLGPSPTLMEKYQEGLPPISRRSTKLTPIDNEIDAKGEDMYSLDIFEEPVDQLTEEFHWLPEQVEDYFDAMSICNDQLVVARGWWILEVWPVTYKVQKADSDEWEDRLGWNLGRHRAVEDTEPNLHWTVKHRMREMGYKINARTGRDAVWQVVT